jgi:hypothetical protein
VTTTDFQTRQMELVRHAIVRLRSRLMALVFAMVGGTGLFVATVWLLVRGGHNVGEHLGLLGNYFPGYTVSPLGALLGFFYGALTGAVLGWSISWIYNRVAGWRSGD